MTRDGDTRGATSALPPSCATAPGLICAHPHGTGFAAAPNIPNPASSRSQALSQQHQGGFHHKPAESKNCLESPNHSEGPGSSTRDPDPALPVGEQQRALLGLGASSRIPLQDPLRIPGGSEPFPVLPHGPDSSRRIWSHGEQAAPEDARATITVIRNGGSGLADPAGMLQCFMEAHIAQDIQGPLMCPMLLHRDVHTCAGTRWAELSQIPSSHG